GYMVYANEPILNFEGPLAHCQLLETAILKIVIYQSLIETKARLIKAVIEYESLFDCGSRRAQEMVGALWWSRAAFGGGAAAPSQVRG
ncbi:nicotinate phosphoribosyltransferase, partial [Streptococcus suis]